MFAALRSNVVTKSLKRVPTLPPFLTIKLQREVEQLSKVRCATAPSEQQTAERVFLVLTPNVQISARSKARAPALAIAHTGYPDLVLLQEKGKVPAT